MIYIALHVMCLADTDPGLQFDILLAMFWDDFIFCEICLIFCWCRGEVFPQYGENCSQYDICCITCGVFDLYSFRTSF